MCLALGKRDEGSELHCVDFKWSGLCGTSICVIYRDGSFTSTVSQIMTLVYATIGPAADYGTLGRWLLLSDFPQSTHVLSRSEAPVVSGDWASSLALFGRAGPESPGSSRG